MVKRHLSTCSRRNNQPPGCREAGRDYDRRKARDHTRGLEQTADEPPPKRLPQRKPDLIHTDNQLRSKGLCGAPEEDADS